MTKVTSSDAVAGLGSAGHPAADEGQVLGGNAGTRPLKSMNWDAVGAEDHTQAGDDVAMESG